MNMRYIILNKYSIEHPNRVNEYHFNNKHVYIQPSAGNAINENCMFQVIKNSNHQVYHIFELVPNSVMNILKTFITETPKSSRVIIHIPKPFKDWKRYLENKLEKEGINLKENKAKIIIDKLEPIKFVVEGPYHERTRFIVGYEKIGNKINLSAYIQNSQFDFYCNEFSYNYLWNPARKDNPELFRDDIIKDFRKNNPKNIVSTFRDDNDIWDYIMQQGEWDPNGDEL